MKDWLAKISLHDPTIADFIRDYDMSDIVQERADNALNRVAELEGIQRGSTIEDWGGTSISTHNGKQILGSLKTAKMPKGVGIVIGDNNEITFVGDIYTAEWRAEADRLQKLFSAAFRAELYCAFFTMIQYDEASITVGEVNGRPTFQVEVAKHEESGL